MTSRPHGAPLAGGRHVRQRGCGVGEWAGSDPSGDVVVEDHLFHLDIREPGLCRVA